MEELKKFSNCNVNCCVKGCKSIRKKTNNIMYHSFPKYGQKVKVTDNFGNVRLCERRKMWQTNLRMTKKVCKYMTVCSLHFRATDYTCSGWSTRKRLLQSAIPSENLPTRQQLGYDTERDKCNKMQDIKQPRKKQKRLNRLITEIETTAECQDSNKVKEDSSTLNRGIEFVNVNSIDNNNSNSESINYRSNVLCESVNIKIEYDPENIQHYAHLTDEYRQEFIIKTDIDIKEEIM